MKKKKIKNPLIKRIPRELLGDWKKYLVVALFLILTIGFVSGMYVANESMLVAANEGVTKYKLEDGHFELDKKADETLLAAIETGTKADVKKYYLDKDYASLEKQILKAAHYHASNWEFKIIYPMNPQTFGIEQVKTEMAQGMAACDTFHCFRFFAGSKYLQ